MKHEDADRHSRQIIDPVRQTALDNQKRLPDLLAQSSLNGLCQIAKLAIFRNRIQGSIRERADAVINRSAKPPEQGRTPWAGRNRRIQIRVAPEVKPDTAINQATLLLLLLAVMYQRDEPNSLSQSGQMRGVKVLVTRASRKNGKVLVQDKKVQLLLW